MLRPAAPLEGGRLRFGGVAFKYQKTLLALEEEAGQAIQYTDVIATSGAKTGEAASVEKVSHIREHIGPERKLALMSGVTAENIVFYHHW